MKLRTIILWRKVGEIQFAQTQSDICVTGKTLCGPTIRSLWPWDPPLSDPQVAANAAVAFAVSGGPAEVERLFSTCRFAPAAGGPSVVQQLDKEGGPREQLDKEGGPREQLDKEGGPREQLDQEKGPSDVLATKGDVGNRYS